LWTAYLTPGRAARGHVPPRRAEPDLRALIRALKALASIIRAYVE
jgi:hypothetical protein